MVKGRILIVDDNSNAIKALTLFLKYEFEEVKGITNPNSIPAEFQNSPYDVVLLDMNFHAGMNTGNEGFFWLKEIKKLKPETEVVMITAYGDVDLAVRAIKEGAADFIQKPWENERVIATLKSAFKLVKARREVKVLKHQKEGMTLEFNRPNRMILGSSSVMLRLMQVVKKIAATEANVLITGENGTGKEVFARQIHQLSDRSKELLVSVDMGTIPETLFESELLGHKKGSFTDASEDKIGKFELANGGTLFLDEIGNLPLSNQSKLLVALQNRGVIPLGGREEVAIDFRLISATNSSIDNMVEKGLFREDLLYRINTILIEIPPLRDRLDDIEALSTYFLNKYKQKYKREDLSFTKGVFPKLKEYHWPGNIRELDHSIERTVILSNGKFIHPEELLFSPTITKTYEMAESFEEMEKLIISNALMKFDQNYTAAAAQLGVTRQTLYNKSKKYGI